MEALACVIFQVCTYMLPFGGEKIDKIFFVMKEDQSEKKKPVQVGFVS